MTISPAQCRAARALLGWSQEELSNHSRIAKKSIADFERGARLPHDRTVIAVRSALESSGIEFIQANGGGAGVRERLAMPRLLFRRDDVPDRRWVAFAFDYKSRRYVGFVEYDALAGIALDNLSPKEVFDRDRLRILLHAANMVDEGNFDPEGRVLIKVGDMRPIEFHSDEEREAGG